MGAPMIPSPRNATDVIFASSMLPMAGNRSPFEAAKSNDTIPLRRLQISWKNIGTMRFALPARLVTWLVSTVPVSIGMSDGLHDSGLDG